MPRAATIPSDSDLLCECCGYILTSLDQAGNCPECGQLIGLSLPSIRHAPVWEDRQGKNFVSAGMATSLNAFFTPRRFFRHLVIPGNLRASRWFGRFYQFIAALLLGTAAWIHAERFGLLAGRILMPVGSAAALVSLIAATWGSLLIGNHLFIRVTAFEARYRGLRLPREVVRHAMDYHAVHLLPPAMAGLAVVVTYMCVERRDAMLAAEWIEPYLYILGGAVVVSAGYLFVTYWIAMKRLMYGNRSV